MPPEYLSRNLRAIQVDLHIHFWRTDLDRDTDQIITFQQNGIAPNQHSKSNPSPLSTEKDVIKSAQYPRSAIYKMYNGNDGKCSGS